MEADPAAETVTVSPEMLRGAKEPEPLESTAERRRPLFTAEDYPNDAQATVMLPTGKPEVVPPMPHPLTVSEPVPAPAPDSYGIRSPQAQDTPTEMSPAPAPPWGQVKEPAQPEAPKAPLAGSTESSWPVQEEPSESSQATQALSVAAPSPAVAPLAASAPAAASQAPLRPSWPATGSASTASGPRSEADVLLEGSSVIGQPASRAPWHWGGTLVTFVLLPFAWYLSHAGKARIAENLPVPGSPYTAGVDVVGLVEVCAGMAALVVALLVARKSAAGAISVGTVSVLLGLPFVVVPHMTWDYLSSLAVRLTEQSTLGANLVRFFIMDGFSGTFLLLGVAMIMVGVVAFSTRRAGRREREILSRKRD